MREHNVMTVLRLIEQDGPITRTDLGRRSGLTKASITRILQDLMARGLVTEDPDSVTRTSGRPATMVRLRPGAYASVGIDCRIDRCCVLLRDITGEELGRWERDMPAGITPDTLFGSVLDHVSLMSDHLPHSLLGVGVAVGGSPSEDGQGVASSVYLGWEDVRVAPWVTHHLGASVPVRVLDVSSAAAQANAGTWPSGEAGGASRAGARATMHLQYGVGLGAGTPGGWDTSEHPEHTAVAISHVPLTPEGPRCPACGWRGCADAMLGFGAVVRRTAALGIPVSTAPDYMARYCAALADLAEQGSPRAVEALEELARDVAQVTVTAARLTGTSSLTLGGWPAYVGPRFVDDVARRVAQHHHGAVINLQLSPLGEDASLVGAALVGAAVGLDAGLGLTTAS